VRTDDFDYDLPPSFIAQHPAQPRDSSRLMVLDRATGSITHAVFRDLPKYMNPGDVLVVNETRVLPARLTARKVPSGGRVEILLLRRIEPRLWEVIVGGRGIGIGTVVQIEAGPRGVIEAVGQGPVRQVRFGEPISPLLESIGAVPLPPYIHEPLRHPSDYQTVFARRPGSAAGPTAGLHFTPPLLESIGAVPLPPYIHEPLRHPSDYQTVFARRPGSAAGPTAGLHFTPPLLESIAAAGVVLALVTLHVGLDTFAPVDEDDPRDHHIHREYCELEASAAEAVNRARRSGRRVVAVGTTTVRTLETAARGAGPGGTVAAFGGETDLLILPGHVFRAVDVMITNFHLPRSTLLMLVSAFAGRERILAAYEAAKAEGYRFYSFGDAMLIV
jgi:S-adenosylmethionine:tRNA ribosyltransferase-isomerase